MYFLKKCGFQELGSVSNGRASRGRYLLISKDDRVQPMFPPLSKTQLNDSAVIPIIPLYSNKKVYCKFVYHNSKHATPQNNENRDEYRLYLNKDLENNQLLFSEGDIVIMRTFQVTGDDNDVQTNYFLDLIKETEVIYPKLAKAIEDSDIRGGYSIYLHEIPEFEKRAAIRMRSTEEEVAVIDDVTQQITHPEGSFISTLFNSVSFRDFVLAGYEYKCAVTEKVIRYDNFMNLEAAHIKPKSHGGSHMPNNGLALGRDMHWAFDKGFYTLNEEYEICVHEKVESNLLHSYNGKQILMPDEQFFCPLQSNMQYHRENVYGLFLTSGRL